jgi:hypothetical protein
MAAENIVIIFFEGKDGGPVGRLDSGKFVLLRRGSNSPKVQIGEAWKCLIEEKEKFCLATPVARQEEREVFAKQGNLFWRIRSGKIIQEEEILDYEFFYHYFSLGFNYSNYKIKTENGEYQLPEEEEKELSGNLKFQKAKEKRAAEVEAAERAEEARYEKERAERFQSRLKSFGKLAQSLKESGEFKFSGDFPLEVETLSGERFVVFAYEGRKLEVDSLGDYYQTGFTFRDDSDEYAWRTSATTIRLGGPLLESEKRVALEGFDGFLFETVENHKLRLAAEKLAKARAEAEETHSSATAIKKVNPYFTNRKRIPCLCGSSSSPRNYVWELFDKERRVEPFVCDECLTQKARELIEKCAFKK